MKTTICLLMHFLAAAVQAGDSSRENIVERMYEFMNIDLRTSDDSTCREDNLKHANLACRGCGHQTSDILWHHDFLDGQMGEIIWWGMPYAFGHGYLPDNGVQSAIDACKALGNHLGACAVGRQAVFDLFPAPVALDAGAGCLF